MRKPSKRYIEMTKAELAKATREYDREMLNVKPVPVSAEARARLQRVLAKKNPRGRPVVGKGARRVMITVEKGLLHDADDYARRTGISRSQLIAVGLRMALKRSA
jgi:hypothetical protein